jgi:hypothetical protein
MKGLKQVIGDPNYVQEVFTNPTLPLAMPVCATPAVPVRADESTGVVDGLGHHIHWGRLATQRRGPATGWRIEKPCRYDRNRYLKRTQSEMKPSAQ